MANLCQWCKQINFAAILTPREENLTTGAYGPIYRKEYAGDGFCPTVRFQHYGKTVRTGPPESYLPQIRTAHWDDLVSNSARSESSFGAGSAQFESENSEGNGSVGSETHSGDEGSDDDEAVDEDQQSDYGTSSEGLSSIGEKYEGGQDSEDGQDPLLSRYKADQKSEEPHHSLENLELDESGDGVQEFPDDHSEASTHPERHIHEEEGGEERPKAREANSKPQPQPKTKDRVAKFGIPIHSRKHSSDLSDPKDDHSSSASSASTWSNFSHFTELERIDLAKQAEGKFEYKRKQLYYLGTIWDVYSRRHRCDLCSYFWRRMRTDEVVRRAYITKSRCVLKCVEFECKSLENPEEKGISMLNLLAIYCYKLGDPGANAWNVRAPFVLQGRHRGPDVPPLSLWDGAKPFRDEMFGEARLREDICDTSLFCQWLSLCETEHKHIQSLASGDMAFRLIDLYDSCLVEWKGAARDLPRYFVLSYIWGTSGQRVMLTRKSYSKLHTKGALGSIEFNNTIRDALELVQEMGERYLWIDALCIVQDDDEDKRAQIPQMHLIYGLATLAVIAAYGEDADAGLAGIQPESRNGNSVLLQLEDISLLCRSATEVFYTDDDIGVVENYLWKSKYSSRGWTFQEALLSTRALIFTRKQVFWECPTCTWCEETHWESKTLAYVGQRGIINPMPHDIWVDNFDRRAYGGPGETTGEFQRNSYANLVRAYSQRQLTDDGDILNAFVGVLASIEAREKTRFLYALRERHFGNDLLWGCDAPKMPRPNAKWVGKKLVVTSSWPSWSWLAWKGIIEIPNEPRHNSYDPTDDIEPSDGVRCYILEHDEIGPKLRAVNENGGWRFYEGYAKRGGGIFDPTWFQRPKAGSERRELQWKAKSSAMEEKPQDITLANLETLPCFQDIKPNFHIFFYTWSTPVILRTNGRNRNLYVDNGVDEELSYGWVMNGQYHGSEDIFTSLIPNGRYEALHMNNNQCASFGHMLVRWNKGIARRICMCIGPLEVWEEKFCASWKLIVLG